MSMSLMNVIYTLLRHEAGAGGSAGGSGGGIFPLIENPASDYQWINEVLMFLNSAIIPFIITLCIAGAFLVIFLAVLMVKAESSGDAEKYKKRLIGILATIAIVIVLLFAIGFFLPQIPSIIDGIRGATWPSSS